MNVYFSIGEAAKAVHMTSETLRHYDRIGLVRPGKKDEWTGYRYYTEQDIVRLNTVRALQRMDIPLQKIKEVLAYDDLPKIIAFLREAESLADEKIAALQYAKAKIQLARNTFENKLRVQPPGGEAAVQRFPRRVIMLSDSLETPTLHMLWGYLSHFYDKIEPARREAFAFEDLAGIYTENGVSRLFAVCIRHGQADGLKTLPGGDYLCADCTEENRADKLNELLETASKGYRVQPAFALQQIVVCGILQWKYQVQVPLVN